MSLQLHMPVVLANYFSVVVFLFLSVDVKRGMGAALLTVIRPSSRTWSRSHAMSGACLRLTDP